MARRQDRSAVAQSGRVIGILFLRGYAAVF
jgi:hypothetical protein